MNEADMRNMPLETEDENGEMDEAAETAKRATLAGMKIDRTAHYDEEKRSKLEQQFKQYQGTNGVPFRGVEGEEDES